MCSCVAAYDFPVKIQSVEIELHSMTTVPPQATLCQTTQRFTSCGCYHAQRSRMRYEESQSAEREEKEKNEASKPEERRRLREVLCNAAARIVLVVLLLFDALLCLFAQSDL